MSSPVRVDGRRADQLRPFTIEANIAPYASGSVLVGFGLTRVICAATIEAKVPSWMRQQGVSGGWLTAEYSMLPYSTLERKPRDIVKGKIDGRTVEIQRLIGRSLRAVLDLKKLGEHTLWIDCDVLQADGGTRCASITGAFVALHMALEKLVQYGRIKKLPVRDFLAATSVGIVKEKAMLDLCYEEDSTAEVDMNVVMTGSGRFVELQATAEQVAFDDSQMAELVALGRVGVSDLILLQKKALGLG